jgi:uncharacterized membrane protein
MEKLKFVPLLLFLFILVAAQPAQALPNIDMRVSTNEVPQDSVSSCPDSIISSDVLKVTITNNGESTDTLLLSLDWIDNSGFILPDITLASGESREIEPLWLTVPFSMEPGTYAARIEAESTLTGETENVDVKVNVLRCRSVDLSVTENFQETCTELTEPVQYSVTVTNNGKWDESFQLTADMDWVIFSDSTVYLLPGESKAVTVTATPPEGLEGSQKITLTASPTDSRFAYIRDTENLFLDIKDCYKFSAAITPSEGRTCSDRSTEFTLIIDNTGSVVDTYHMTAPDWIEMDETVVSLEASERGEISFTALPEATGITEFSIEVRSISDESVVSPTASLIVEECRGFEIVQLDVEKTVCAGLFPENFTVQIQNTGSVENEISLSTSFGELEEETVTLAPGEIHEALIRVVSSAEEGVQEFNLTATDGVSTRVAEMRMISESCYSADMLIEPESQTACPYTNVEYMITVTNLGNLEDTYTVSYGVGSETVTLLPAESAEMFFILPADYPEAGVYAIRVNLTSANGIETSKVVSLNVKELGECYSVELTDGDGTVETGKAIGKEINVKNTGEVAGVFQLSLEAPEWVLIKPVTVSLESGQEESAYVYISPLYATTPGDYIVKVKAASQYATGEFDLTVTVPEGQFEEVEPPEVPEEPENVTEPPEDNITTNETEPTTNITLNVSTEDDEINDSAPITGEVVGEDSDADRQFRTMAIAVIAIIIIIILAARFVLLFKK